MMKPHSSTHHLPFNRLIHLFTRISDKVLIENPSVGEGTIQFFNIEKGLQARVWDCAFTGEMTICNQPGVKGRNDGFTVAYFFNINSLQFATGEGAYQSNMLWDVLFVSAASGYKLHIDAAARVHCLSIRFSMDWLRSVLEGNKAFKKLKEQMYAADRISLLNTMSISEKKQVQELINISGEEPPGSFYIKSAVLKIVSDFLHKLKEQDGFSIIFPCTSTVLAEVEQYLSDHAAGPLPDLKALAQRFSMSESTLKRQFKKKYGVNMSTYFYEKKRGNKCNGGKGP